MPEIMYRPPFEAGSFLLEVTKSCSHNRCSFCTMYRDVPFRVISMEEVEGQIRDAIPYAAYIDRVFLENGDAFVLSGDKLIEIAELIHMYLPRVETIAMYASIKNIQGKTDDELKALRQLGINELNIGVESGLDEALEYMNKGYTCEEAVYQLNRLKKAGMDYGANIILGCAGPTLRKENALATAKLLNETKPYLIFTGTLHADPGCPLYEDMKNGSFIENTFGEYLEEEEILLSQLQLDDCYYFGLHPSNVVPMHGTLKKDMDKLMQEISRKREALQDRLDERPVRTGEGAIINML